MAENDQNHKETVQKEGKRMLLGEILRESLLDVFFGLLFVLGFSNKFQKKEGDQTMPERQTPTWFLKAFPSLTRDDDNEYNLALDSAPKDAKVAAKEFRTMMINEGIYDDVKYIVYLIELRREFVEQVKHPAPANKGKGGGSNKPRLDFGELTINDSVSAFFNELLEEKNADGTPEEIYERQKERARERNLLPRKHLYKKIHEWTSTHKLETLVGIALSPFVFFGITIWLLGG